MLILRRKTKKTLKSMLVSCFTGEAGEILE